ncbi:hypothetical protein [Aeromonas hydrophila]|uniref:hypothetical protein n=1 Tax=Aeromonas hydrophila TaxID=644 RepID=UPI0009C16D92|nr:hypothetical protein [Aeromonas hydrophila]
MEYASQLPDPHFNQIYDLLEQRVSAAARAAYNSRLSKAKTREEREACAGCYPSAWSELFNQWCRDKVTNQHVLDCLKLGDAYSGQELAN